MPGKGKGTIECITLYSFIRKKLMDGQTSSGDTYDKVGVIQFFFTQVMSLKVIEIVINMSYVRSVGVGGIGQTLSISLANR